MHQSFQTTTYNHAQQHQKLGPSGLKIFNGEDLSTLSSTQLAAIVRDCNNYNPIFGGNNNNNKDKIDSNNNKTKKNSSTNKHYRSPNIVDNSKRKNKKD
jgi:hypothetical protein